jgi:hypothetical protein
MRPHRFFTASSLFVAAAAILTSAASAEDLSSLPLLKNYTAQRAASTDPSGANDDGNWKNPIKPGEQRTIAQLTGPGTVNHMWFTIATPEEYHLKKIVLRIFWDDDPLPAVESPIGDFFGLGLGEYFMYESGPLSVGSQKSLNCYFPMPFRKSARITITNQGRESSRHWFEVNYKALKELPADAAYFHAQYRQATPPPEGLYTILEAKGRGHLVGCVLSVKNRDGGWWGEGDEVLWIDGKQAIQGTGSEDYFLESYGLRPGCFPYHGVTICEEPFATAYRWHIVDPVPFRESLRFAIEHGPGAAPWKSGNYYYSVAYWYQTEPHAAFPRLPPIEERVSWEKKS